MSLLTNYQKRLKGRNNRILQVRRDAANLNNELAFHLGDGYKQGSTLLSRTQIDVNADEWLPFEIAVKNTLTGQEKKVVTRNEAGLKIGSYVKYPDGDEDVTLIIRERLMDNSDVMPSYKAYVCQSMLRLKGCPYEFPTYGFNSTYSSKGMVDSGQVLTIDSRNKIYVQKNKYTVRLYDNHKNYRIILGDEETKYRYVITEMDDVSYPGMFVITLKSDEGNPADEGFYAYNKEPIDFSDLFNDGGMESPTLYCESYYRVGDLFMIDCNKQIQNVELNNDTIATVAKVEDKSIQIKANTKGLLNVKVTDVDGLTAEVNIIIKAV